MKRSKEYQAWKAYAESLKVTSPSLSPLSTENVIPFESAARGRSTRRSVPADRVTPSLVEGVLINTHDPDLEDVIDILNLCMSCNLSVLETAQVVQWLMSQSANKGGQS